VLQVQFDLILSVIPEAATRLDSTSCRYFYMKMTPMITKPQVRDPSITARHSELVCARVAYGVHKNVHVHNIYMPGHLLGKWTA
jgi:hypothetical protein